MPSYLIPKGFIQVYTDEQTICLRIEQITNVTQNAGKNSIEITTRDGQKYTTACLFEDFMNMLARAIDEERRTR